MTRPATREDYDRAFRLEQARHYPTIGAFEARTGYAIDRTRLETAARVLACPIKASEPNWQHGRVIYALTRRYLAERSTREAAPVVRLLDIGTAKGFSALCFQWALLDAGVVGDVVSVDVLDPAAALARNSIADVDGPSTLRQLLEPWPDAEAITFLRTTGQLFLTGTPGRIGVAFVDGRHSYEAVSWEAVLLTERQRPGDVVIFDDIQIAGVARAVTELEAYEVEYLAPRPDRIYAIGVRR